MGLYGGGGIISWLIVGLIAGAIAGNLMGVRRIGIIGSVFLGIVGAVLGNYLFRMLGLSLPIGHPLISEIIIGTIGAALLVFVVRLFERV